MSRALKFRQVDLQDNSVAVITKHLDRIGRTKDQVRYSNSKGLMYCFVVKKIDQNSFWGHIAGPDTNKDRRDKPLSIKIQVKQNSLGACQVSILFRDVSTSYEESMEIAKHATSRIISSLEGKPLKLVSGIDKSRWNGYYLFH